MGFVIYGRKVSEMGRFTELSNGKRVWSADDTLSDRYCNHGMGEIVAQLLGEELGFSRSPLSFVYYLGDRVEGSNLYGRVEVIPFLDQTWLVRSMHITSELTRFEDLLDLIRARWADGEVTQ